jgi:Tfp pilus assembly PilM family ATPase/Tfp pilus assembly protein PilN
MRAVQLVRAERELCLEKIFCTQIRRSTDSLPESLRLPIGQHGFDRRAAIAVSVPQDAVFFRNVETDAAGLEQIRKHDSSMLEHHFPIAPGEILAQPHSHRQLSNGRYSVLTAAVSRESLRQRRRLLADAKLQPTLAEAAIFAVHCAVTVNHPEIMVGSAVIAYVDESYLTLAVTHDNDILLVRNLRLLSESDSSVGSAQEQLAEVLSREVQISWRKVFGSEIKQDGRLYLAVGNGISAEVQAAVVEKLPCQTVCVDPCANIKLNPDCSANGSICLAEGLALRGLEPEATAGVNFLGADEVVSKPVFNLKKEMAIFAALVGAVAVFSLVGLFGRLFYMERDYARLKEEISKVFQAALPEEENVVNPLAQLEQKIQAFQKDYQLFAAFHPTDMAPLQVLQRISVSMPAQAGFKVDDLLVTPSSVRVSGTCQSFEPVYQWQGILQKLPGFALVDVDARKEPQSGSVSFTILISSERAGEPQSNRLEIARMSP